LTCQFSETLTANIWQYFSHSLFGNKLFLPSTRVQQQQQQQQQQF
jgi:hypothetical protein